MTTPRLADLLETADPGDTVEIVVTCRIIRGH